MYQHLSKPDLYFGMTGHLNAAVHERRISGAPAFLRGLRVAFVSDTHVTRRATRADLEALVEKLAGMDAALVLLGGDYSDTAEGTERFFDALKALKPRLGMFGVAGNNDAEAWEGRMGELRGLMRRAGCRLLVNEAARVPLNGGSLWIGGVDEHRYSRADSSALYPVRPAPNRYRVLLSHYPILPELAPELMLCGHTHGGQFNLLGVTPFSIGFERLSRKPMKSMAVAGLLDVDGMKLLVSKGVGASRLQLRIGVRPELELLIFE